MSEVEKQIAEMIKATFPKMSDFDKGYILGKVEQIAADHPAPQAPKEKKEDTEDLPA